MDFFNNFDDFECETSDNIKTSSYPPYSPCFHEKNWFLNSNVSCLEPKCLISELDLYRISHLFNIGETEKALEIVEEIRKSTKNNRFHEIMLIDSILQCYIKIPANNFNESICLKYIDEYKALLVDFGDQIQYLRTVAQVSSRFSYSTLFLDTLSLLCSLSDLPENWLLFEKCTISNTNNIKIYWLTKSLMLYEYQISQAKGFVKKNIEKNIEKLKARIEETGVDAETLTKIRQSMHHHSTQKSDNEDQSTVFRAHDCRAKNKFIDINDQTDIIHSFRLKYSAFFDLLS